MDRESLDRWVTGNYGEDSIGDDEPADDDYIVNGKYEVWQSGRLLFTSTPDENANGTLDRRILAWQDAEKEWSNVWNELERGGYDLRDLS